jgi:tetratricopeptide (TPR) repeat protein
MGPLTASGRAYADYEKGVALAKEGKHKEAIGEFNKAIDTNPRYAEAYKAAAESHMALKQLAEAVSAYRRAIVIQEDSPLQDGLGVAYAMQGNYDDAITAFRRSVRLGSTDPMTYINLARAYLRNGQHRYAVYELESALKLNSDCDEAYNVMGNVYVDWKKYPQALDAYLKAEHANPKSADVQYNLGVLYDDFLPDKGEALRHFQKYLDLTKSGDPEVIKRMKEIVRENVK